MLRIFSSRIIKGVYSVEEDVTVVSVDSVDSVDRSALLQASGYNNGLPRQCCCVSLLSAPALVTHSCTACTAGWPECLTGGVGVNVEETPAAR